MVSADLGTWILATIIGGIVTILVTVIGVALQVMLLYGGDFMAMSRPDASFADTIRLQLQSNLIGLLPSGFSYMLFFGLSNMAVRKAQGHEITATDVFLPFRRFGPVYLTVLLCTILLYLGFIALILPFFYLVGALSLATLIAINQPVGPVEAIKKSVRILGSQAWMMLLLSIVGYILWFLGFMVCLVGALFTTPVFAALYGLHYHYFFPPATAPYVPTADVPSSY